MSAKWPVKLKEMQINKRFFLSFFLPSEDCAGLLHLLAVHCCSDDAALLDVVQVVHLMNML